MSGVVCVVTLPLRNARACCMPILAKCDAVRDVFTMPGAEHYDARRELEKLIKAFEGHGWKRGDAAVIEEIVSLTYIHTLHIAVSTITTTTRTIATYSCHTHV